MEIDEIERIKKKLKKEFLDNVEMNEDSDIPVTEKKTKEKNYKNA